MPKDDLLFEMLCNNPLAAVYKAFSEALFKGAGNLFKSALRAVQA